MIVVADTSVVLNLRRIRHEQLLSSLFGRVLIPAEVASEFVQKPFSRSIRREPDHYSFGNRREIRSGSRQMLLSEWVAKVSGLRLFIRQHKTAHALRNRQRR